MNNKFIPIDFVEISDFVIINDNQIEIPDIENKEENIEIPPFSPLIDNETFKVKNLFSEIKTQAERQIAAKNLGIDNIKIQSATETEQGIVYLTNTVNESNKAITSNAVYLELNKKQNTIADIESIREGAEKGKTAIQDKELQDAVKVEKERAENVENALDGKINNYKQTVEEVVNNWTDNTFVIIESADEEIPDVPEYITKIDLDNAITQALEDAVEQPIIQQTETTVAIAPNVLNLWGEVATLDITLGEPKEGIINEYMFQFTSGATATTLILPADIKWLSEPNVQANKTYQVSIINNLGVIGEFSHE